MTRRSHAYDVPKAYLKKGQKWPEGVLRKNAPLPAKRLQVIVQAMEQARIEQRWSRQALADTAGLGHATLERLAYGTGWPDLVTIVLLEEALDTPLLQAE